VTARAALGIAVVNGRSSREPRLWLLGYGAASATLAGITRSARDTVRDVQQFLTQGRT
jgi:putative flavoprotein involved in K+ transport